MKTKPHQRLAFFAALAGIPLTALAAEFSPAKSVGAPEGLSTSDWSGIRSAYEAGRHAVLSDSNGTLTARNPGQQWTTTFDGRGFTSTPDAGGWSWGFDLKAYGFGHAMISVGESASVSHEGGKVSYQWDGNLREWFINDTRGVEQGWTFQRRPEGAVAGGSLHLDLTVRGGIVPRVSDDSASVSFIDGNGGSALTYGGLKAWDADGKKLVVRFESVGDKAIRVAVDESAALYPITIDPVAQQAYLKASNTGKGDWFGESVSVSGNTVVVGAPREGGWVGGINKSQTNDPSLRTGAVYVFVKNGATWTQQAYIKAPDPIQGDLFGSSVAISGDMLVVGAPSGENYNTGVVYVFLRNGTTWSQRHTVTGRSYFPNVTEFGGAVALSEPVTDETGGVARSYRNLVVTWAWGTFIFEIDESKWTQTVELETTGSVAVSGNTVVLGNSSASSPGRAGTTIKGTGAAYVYESIDGAWPDKAEELRASNKGQDDGFGSDVAISGDTIVVGATGEDSDWKDFGAAYIFTRNAGKWAEQTRLKASPTFGGGASFGCSVAISGDTVVVGAYQESNWATGVDGDIITDVNAPDFWRGGSSGAAFLFKRTSGAWTQTAYLKASNTGESHHFGESVSVSGNLVVIGAPSENGNSKGVNGRQSDQSAEEAGACYVFDLNAPPAPEIVVQQPQGSNLVDHNSTKSFGKKKIGKKGKTRVFTIKNTGTAKLTGLAITKDGKHRKDFIVSAPVKSSLAAGASTTFKVSFKPKAKGTRKAAIHIKSNDGNENPFDIKVTGLGAAP